MNMPSHLTTEVRVNKNGVPVKKRVLAGPKSGAAAGTKAIPAPSVSMVTTKPKKPKVLKAQDILDHLRKRDEELVGSASLLPKFGYELPYIDKWEPKARQDLFNFITTADRMDYSAIREIFQHDYDKPNKVSLIVNTMATVRKINDMAIHGYEYSAADDIGQLYSSFEMKDFRGEMEKYHFDVIKAETLAKHLGIRKGDFSMPHQFYQKVELLRANMDIIEPVIPIILADSNTKGYGGSTAEQALEIAEYGQARLDHIDFIVETVKERGEFNAELIEEMITSGAVALNSGML